MAKKPYTVKDLRNALADVSEGSSMRLVADKFGIPYTVTYQVLKSWC